MRRRVSERLQLPLNETLTRTWMLFARLFRRQKYSLITVYSLKLNKGFPENVDQCHGYI